MVQMDVAAERATLLPKLGSPSRKLSVQASHTVDEQRDVTTMVDRRSERGCTSSNWRSPPVVYLVEESASRHTSVAREGIHHARIGSDSKYPV